MSYLINCEYFNNLNGDGDRTRMGYGGDMYIPIPIPIPNWKSRGFPIPIPSQCGDSPTKWGRVQAIPTGTSLFVISTRNVSLELWLRIGVKHVAFLELWLEMISLELCGSGWQMNTRNYWVMAWVGECCRCECASCGSYGGFR